jgi:hypothetical protein
MLTLGRSGPVGWKTMCPRLARLVGCFATVAAASLPACRAHYEVGKVRQHIHLCESTPKDVLAEYGRPNVVGEIGGLVTYAYGDAASKLLIAFDARDRVVDVAVNATGLVELRNRCDAAVSPLRPPPAPPTSSTAPGNAL